MCQRELNPVVEDALAGAVEIGREAEDGTPLKAFGQKAEETLLINGVVVPLPVTKEVSPAGSVRHGGGVGAWTLWASHNTPQPRRR